MVVMRDVFEVSAARLSDAVPVIRHLEPAGVRAGLGPRRLMIDRSGEYFAREESTSRLVIEREYSSFANFSERMAAARGDAQWLAAWSACRPFVHRAWREVLDDMA